jgi:hypothetical protein
MLDWLTPEAACACFCVMLAFFRAANARFAMLSIAWI